MKKLNELAAGESGRVLEITSDSKIRRRLQDIGIVNGTKITCLFKSPLGDITAFHIRGAVIAIRSIDSSNVLMQ